MLTGDLKSVFVKHNESANCWGIQFGCPQWSGWVNWYHYELGKVVFSKWLTVPTEWPPTTEEAAANVAKWLSDIRDGKFNKETVVISTIPVRERPAPWRGDKTIPASPPCTYLGIDFGDQVPWQTSRVPPRTTLPPPEQFT